MATRYSADELLALRDSPLCVKPANLPPLTEWMGSPQENRNPAKPVAKGQESSPHERNLAVAVGLPRNGFYSSFPVKNTGKTSEDRFGTRFRNHDLDTKDRSRDIKALTNNHRRNDDEEAEHEGCNTIKLCKSFGHEGTERFQGRMGFFGNERKGRDRDDSDGGDRRHRNFDRHPVDLDGDEADEPRRNGLARGKLEGWIKDMSKPVTQPSSSRERLERMKNWRERDPDDRTRDRRPERFTDRRWDRDQDQREEREPEWLDEPVDEPVQGHTEEDFRKFMEQMKAGRNPASSKAAESRLETPAADTTSSDQLAEHDANVVKAVSAAAVEPGPDKFFAAFGAGNIDASVKHPADTSNETTAVKVGKASRFTSLFKNQDESRGKTAPPSATAAPLHSQATENGVGSILPFQQQPPSQSQSQTQQPPPPQPQQQTDAEKAAFALLLQKLQHQTLSAQSSGPAISRSDAPRAAEPQLQNMLQRPPQQQQHNQSQQQPQQQKPQQQHQPQQLPHLQFHQQARAQPQMQVHQPPQLPNPHRPQQAQHQPPLQHLQNHRQPNQLSNQQVLQNQYQQLSQQFPQHHPKSTGTLSDVFQQYSGVPQRLEEARTNLTSHAAQDILSPRPIGLPVQPPQPQGPQRPEQALQEILAQRQLASSQGSGRMDHGGANSTSNTEFLMRLMQSARNAPEPARVEQVMMRIPQSQKQVVLPSLVDRGPELSRERSASQRQMRYGDSQFHAAEPELRVAPNVNANLMLHHQQQQAQQQHPRPPVSMGLPIHHPPHQPFPMSNGVGATAVGQMPLGRSLIPPPGLNTNSIGSNNTRNIPIPYASPPNFPPGAAPPHRGMVPPPGFFNGLPPPNVMLPPGMNAYAGPDALAFGGQFDGRGMPPGGVGFRRQ